MKIETFEMERMQCLYEQVVEYNLSESGVLPLKLSELLDGEGDSEHFLAHELWYTESNGSQLFRERIAQFYPECQPGLDKGFRIGFGYDLEKMLNGLNRAEALMRKLL